MYSEYIIDIYKLCRSADMTKEETDFVVSFATTNCDAFPNPLFKSALQKLKGKDLLDSFLNCMITPKSCNTDFDGENGIPN